MRKTDGALELVKDSAMDDEYSEEATSFLETYLKGKSRDEMGCGG